MHVNLTDLLGRRYLATLALVGFLVLLNQLLVLPSLMRLTTDAPIINVAGRQRMLSQRLAKAALALNSDDADKRRLYLDELERVLEIWSTSHDGLRHGNESLSLPGKNSRAVDAAFADLEPLFVRIRMAAEHLINDEAHGQSDKAHSREELATILGAEGQYLVRMDQIVGLYEREARDRVTRLFWTGWVAMVLVMVALVGVGALIVRPALYLIRRQVEELHVARNELEARVQERTVELEIATERHLALVEEFSRVARTTSVGEMATGLAHELKQPLGAIANYAEGCLVELSTPQPAIEEVRLALEKLLAATMRTGKIIDRIRQFVTRQAPRRESFDPNRIIEEVQDIFRDEVVHHGVPIRVDLAPDLPMIVGDAIQIRQVLINLVRNSLDAVASARRDDPAVLIQTERDATGGVAFSVTDNGEGIADESLSRVFEAYFSTRASGMGMGLAISRTIIEAHQGRITFTSVPNAATTFRFTLPAGPTENDGTSGADRR